MYAYSKFRRENANFKINTKVDSEGNPVYVADPSTGSDEPITGLLQILPEGLDCYDFLGMCVETDGETGPDTVAKTVNIIETTIFAPAGSMVAEGRGLSVEFISIMGALIYIPSNGYLVNSLFDFSSIAPEGEDGDDEGRVINLDELQFDFDTKIWSGYEAGLQLSDFAAITAIIMGGVRFIVNEVGLYEDSTVIGLEALAPGQTTPRLFEYYPANGTFSVHVEEGGGPSAK